MPQRAPTGSPNDDFTDFYQRHYQRMVRLAMVLVGSAAPAEELTQDAFVQLLKNWDSIEQPMPYLRIAVVNHCRSWGRRRSLERRRSWPVPPESNTWLDTDAVAVRDGLALLSSRQRAAIVLRYYEDLPEAEIATILGCRPGTVKSLLSRALNKMEGALDDD